MVIQAKSLGVKRISFLSADVMPGAFGRDAEDNSQNNGIAALPLAITNILLNENEIKEFRQIIMEMTEEFKEEFESGFISESPVN